MSFPSRVDTPYEVIKRPKRDALLDIITDGADAQASSPLFKLSGELRALIWEYVVGSGDIHIRERPCKRDNKWNKIEKYRHELNDAPFPATHNTLLCVNDQQSTRLMAYPCIRPDDWSRQYALSQQPAAIPEHCFNKHGLLPRNGPYCAQAISQYSFTHSECCPTMGQTTAGIQLHFLQTCRRIYGEAWHLPFLHYTFEIPGSQSSLREDFTARVLFPHQAHAVESLHVHDLINVTGIDSYSELLQHFPGLKRLRLSLPPGEALDGDHGEWKTFTEFSPLEKVEVIAGYDYDRSDNRALNRVRAGAAEKLLRQEVDWKDVFLVTKKGRFR